MTLPPTSTPRITEQDRLALEQKWQQGVMRVHVSHVLDFVATHRDEILLTAGGVPSAAALLDAVQKVIDAHRTIDIRAELARQREKIAEHIWLSGERGEQDRERLADQWIEIYAKEWREWLVKKYLFTAERYSAAILGTLLFPRGTVNEA
jgi:hypothetical protein